MRYLFSFFLLSIINFNLLAQPGWNWPENKAEAEEKNVLYTDYLKEGNCGSKVDMAYLSLCDRYKIPKPLMTQIFKQLPTAQRVS